MIRFDTRTRLLPRSIGILAFLLVSLVPASAQAQTADSDATLYAQLGGYDAIAHFIGVVFPRVATHPDFAHLFQGHGLDTQQRQFQLVVDMICSSTGGPCAYIGRDMPRVHRGLGVDSADWVTFMGIIDTGIAEVGSELGWSDAVSEEFSRVWEGFRPGVVEPSP